LKILAIDPATHCGWAHNYYQAVRHGTADLSNGRWDGAGMKYLKFEKFLLDKVEECQEVTRTLPDLIVYERVENHSATYAAHDYGAWKAAIQSLGEKLGVKYHGYTVQEIKKYWTGKGNATKQQMIDEARKRKLNPKDDNAADALAILHLAIEDFTWD